MALPLLAGLAIRTVASYARSHGIPAARKAYSAYLKKNPEMKKKIKGTMTDFFKKPSIVSAGNKFKNVKKPTTARKTNTPRTDKKTRSQKAFDKGASKTQAERNKSVRGTVGKVVGVGTAGALVYEGFKGIRASSEAKAEAARKAKLAKNKADEDRRKAKKKTETKTTSAPSRRIDNTADYSRASSDYRSRGTSPKSSRDAKAKAKRPSYFQDIDAKEKKKKDTGGVKTRFGGRVKTKSGSLRTRGN
tara:strand:- start:1640 stop:2380 length:741 start_codon:yes stop_codon:yes gene_type:complete